MNAIAITLLGLIEGLTEFLPISSTFHLLWASRILGLPSTEFVKLFTVVIQAGAILAVVLLYWKEVLTNWKLILKLMASFIPTAVIGLMMYDVIKNVFFESQLGTTIVFIVVGGIFLLVEYLITKKVITTKFDIQKLSYKQAIIIGTFQAFAIIPGVSRAGAVLIGMMLLGFKRSESAKYSFMLSVPTIMAASLFDFIEMRDIVFSHPENIWILGTGSIIAFISALIGVKWLIKYLQHHSLVLFGWYRIVLGIILILLTVFL